MRGKLEKNAVFSTVLHKIRHAQAASAVWASPTIEGDPRRALQALGMTDTDRLLEKSVFFSSLPLSHMYHPRFRGGFSINLRRMSTER